MPAIPTPPPDNAGGFMVVQYTQGQDTHRVRLHVAPFNYPTATQFNYNPVVGAGTEVTPMDTFTAFAAVLKGFIKTTDTISLLALYQTVAGVPTERFGFTQPSGVAGTDTNAVPTNQQRAGYTSINMKSSLGGRAKIVIVGGYQSGSGALAARDSMTSIGEGLVDQIVDYVVGANCGLVCHDGNKFIDAGSVTYGVNKKLRRKYGFT